MRVFETVTHRVTAVQYDGSEGSRVALRELCGHWIMFTDTIPHVTTGRGSVQVRLNDWVAKCDEREVFGFSVVPAHVFEKFYRECYV